MLTRKHFAANAKPITVVINGIPFVADPKEFSTGSLGWNINAKVAIDVGGEKVQCQVGFNLTIAKSKELPHDSAAA